MNRVLWPAILRSLVKIIYRLIHLNNIVNEERNSNIMNENASAELDRAARKAKKMFKIS